LTLPVDNTAEVFFIIICQLIRDADLIFSDSFEINTADNQHNDCMGNRLHFIGNNNLIGQFLLSDQYCKTWILLLTFQMPYLNELWTVLHNARGDDCNMHITYGKSWYSYAKIIIQSHKNYT